MSNGLQPPDTPPVLYKYREFGNDYHWKTIADGEFYCAHADSFNDPFDLNPAVEALSKDDVILRYAKKTAENDSEIVWDSLSESQKSYWKSQVSSVFESGSFGIEDAIEKASEGIKKGPKELFGVLSLSAKRDHPLMWAHYASSHAGFCVGIDSKKLKHRIDKRTDPSVILVKVQYSEHRQPISTADAMRVDEVGVREWLPSFLGKSDVWQYEDEWRVLSLKKPGYRLELDQDLISEVVLGCNISEENKEKVFDLVRTDYTSPPDLFEAVLDDQEYRLNIEPISLP